MRKLSAKSASLTTRPRPESMSTSATSLPLTLAWNAHDRAEWLLSFPWNGRLASVECAIKRTEMVEGISGPGPNPHVRGPIAVQNNMLKKAVGR
jgi:hypothetical protein